MDNYKIVAHKKKNTYLMKQYASYNTETIIYYIPKM